MEFLQTGANKIALEALIEERDVEYHKAVDRFAQGKLCVRNHALSINDGIVANDEYDLAKKDSFDKLERSKTTLAEANGDALEEFRAMEEASSLLNQASCTHAGYIRMERPIGRHPRKSKTTCRINVRGWNSFFRPTLGSSISMKDERLRCARTRF